MGLRMRLQIDSTKCNSQCGAQLTPSLLVHVASTVVIYSIYSLVTLNDSETPVPLSCKHVTEGVGYTEDTIILRSDTRVLELLLTNVAIVVGFSGFDFVLVRSSYEANIIVLPFC